MKYTYIMVLSSVVSMSLTNSAVAASQDREARKAEKQANISKTLETYKACDIAALVTELQGTQVENQSVFKASDKITEGDSYYYEVKDIRSGIFDTNLVKENVCNYIIKNECYVYWNNVIATGKIAPVALKKVLISPPVNLLSPLIGCVKANQSH